jgi:hypothetical protein
MDNLQLTTAELGDLVTALMFLIEDTKKKQYQPTETDRDGLIYKNNKPQSQWEKEQRAYIKRLRLIRAKVYEEYSADGWNDIFFKKRA